MPLFRFAAAVIAVVALAAQSGPSQAADSPARLIDLWQSANGLCRGGAGGEEATLKACDIREDYSQRLDRLGWCYGRDGEYGYQHEWHRCGKGSTRPGR